MNADTRDVPDSACKSEYGDKPFADLPTADKDGVLSRLEKAELKRERPTAGRSSNRRVKDVQM